MAICGAEKISQLALRTFETDRFRITENMKKLFNILVLILTTSVASATTIYEIKYKFGDSDIEYTSFLVRNNNSTGFMRVRYRNKEGVTKVVEMEFDEIQGTSSDNGIDYQTLLFKSKNPRFILGTTTDNYTPDYIWFRKQASQNIYRPWGVVSPKGSNSNEYNQGQITDVKLLNTEDISREYAHRFFGTGETFYVNLFKLDPPGQHPGALKLIIIANTNDVDIGATCQKDINRIKQKFSDIADFLNLQFTYREVSGSDFGKTMVMNTLNNFSSTMSDILVVVYTGHGFHYQNDEDNAYPQFDLTTTSSQDLNNNTVSFAQVYNIIRNKNARLKILLADCCNSYIRLSKNYGASNPVTMRSRVQWDKTNCESLFINTSGMVVAAAAKNGEVARCNNEMGGYFLFNFIESLDNALSVFEKGRSWREIINDTRREVLKLTENTNCSNQICTETTVSHVEVQ